MTLSNESSGKSIGFAFLFACFLAAVNESRGNMELQLPSSSLHSLGGSIKCSITV